MNDNINEWVGRAKAGEHSDEESGSHSGVKVIRKEAPRNRGAIIMAVAEALRPHVSKMFEGKRDAEGLTAQPAHVRAFALNMAQHIVHAHEQDNSALA